jgi:hypothetical protein
MEIICLIHIYYTLLKQFHTHNFVYVMLGGDLLKIRIWNSWKSHSQLSSIQTGTPRVQATHFGWCNAIKILHLLNMVYYKVSIVIKKRQAWMVHTIWKLCNNFSKLMCQWRTIKITTKFKPPVLQQRVNLAYQHLLWMHTPITVSEIWLSFRRILSLLIFSTWQISNWMALTTI